MNPETHTTITTDWGRIFRLTEMKPIKQGTINASSNYTFIIYRTETNEYVRKKRFYNPAMNHSSTNYELLPGSRVNNYR